MERAPHKTAKLTGLIVAIVVIAALVVAVGSLCTCLCTCGTCLGCVDGCPVWSREQAEPPVSAAAIPPKATERPTAHVFRTPSVQASSAPTPVPTAAPQPTAYPIGDEPVSVPQPTSALWVRPHQVQL